MKTFEVEFRIHGTVTKRVQAESAAEAVKLAQPDETELGGPGYAEVAEYDADSVIEVVEPEGPSEQIAASWAVLGHCSICGSPLLEDNETSEQVPPTLALGEDGEDGRACLACVGDAAEG